MERLTTRSSGPLPVLVRGKALGPAYFMSKHEYEDYRDALNKLAAYEDAEEQGRLLVLCKDCKWYEINELKKDGTEDRRYKPSVCMLAEQRREPNHFCADGEKREES